MQLHHAREDAAVLFQLEIFFNDRAGNFDEAGIVQQNRAEDKALRIDVRGKTFFEGDSIDGGGTELHSCGIHLSEWRLWIARTNVSARSISA
jgi:hypothetical protein